MALKPITVTQLNDYIARTLETDPLLSNVTVTGEASGVKYHGSGHVYMSLVDGNSKISCFVPRTYVGQLPFQIMDGMELVITGGIGLYKPHGTYSLRVRQITVAGEGSLAIAFEQMKKRLAAEGLFSPDHKKPIPRFPKKIGVVTSATGAAIQDILKIIRSRNDVVDVLIFPSAVQGAGAAQELAHAVEFANFRYPELDTLIVGRGGGSAEDLWAFNEECLARAIYHSAIPVISAVGHEIDFSISDMVADLRAETPTAAAQIAVPDTYELREYLEDAKQQFAAGLGNIVLYQQASLEQQMQSSREEIRRAMQNAMHQLETYRTQLEAHNPSAVLESGYAVVQDEEGNVITSSDSLEENRDYIVQFSQGTARMRLVGGDNDGN